MAGDRKLYPLLQLYGPDTAAFCICWKQHIYPFGIVPLLYVSMQEQKLPVRAELLTGHGAIGDDNSDVKLTM